MTKLDVFLRTCNKQGIIDNHPVKRRCIQDTRDVMIKKCVSSLVASIEQINVYTKVWIVDDGSSQDFISWLHATCKNISYELIKLPSVGHHKSADWTGRLAVKNGRDLLYMIEDDYFHMPHALPLLVQGHEHLSQQTAWPVAIYPYDCIDRYRRDQPTACKIFYNNNVYWRSINKSTNVVVIKHEVYTHYYRYFDDMYNNYHPDQYHEDHTINKLWNNMVDHAGPISLFSPMPSLAVHLEHQEPTDIQQHQVSWRQQYNSWQHDR